MPQLRTRHKHCALILLTCILNVSVAGADVTTQIDFNRDIRTILTNNCFACHGPDSEQQQADLRLDSREGALAGRNGVPAIVPGNPEASELVTRITAADPDAVMPPVDSGKKLSRREVDLLIRWVHQGAPYARHWSYERPERPPLPGSNQWVRARNGIDRFILQRLTTEGLELSPLADRYTLARRVALDLTGVPPSVAEVDTFVNDHHAGAYEKFVDRMLGKSAYGEHWTRMWLDLARYADSAGYADDPPRTIWAFRDYVIRSLNANKPFDRFTIEQIAGDLLPDPTKEQLIATAFHRNTLTNNEGGTSDEEFRNVAIVDRVNTTMAVWMGTTINCAQCHNHKYDPISQEEYFRFFSIFNNTEDADRPNESPLLKSWTDEQIDQRNRLQADISQREALAKAAGETADKEATESEEAKKAREELEHLRKQLAEVKPVFSVPIMRELQKDRRTTRIQRRGNFLDTAAEVTEGVPAVFHMLSKGKPPNRMALARWLIAPENPLTARVIANRYWESIFGTGIVRTSEEFGAQGELPSHPKLLDWLAVDLVDHGWDLKYLLRLMVTSGTYRQTSNVTEELVERDLENRLLARGPRFRLTAEMIRDQALAVSGLLSGKLYGPPVKPPQPVLGTKAAFGSDIDWQESSGENRHRRGLYTTWRRSNPYPSMATFDAPNREVCTVRRDQTNTPLQALVTLNDPVYVEAARSLAHRIARLEGQPADKAHYGFRLCLARPPREGERSQLVQLYQQVHQRFAADPERARRLATNPLSSTSDGTDLTELAAWTVVGNVLLNLDELLMKR